MSSPPTKKRRDSVAAPYQKQKELAFKHLNQTLNADDRANYGDYVEIFERTLTDRVYVHNGVQYIVHLKYKKNDETSQEYSIYSREKYVSIRLDTIPEVNFLKDYDPCVVLTYSYYRDAYREQNNFGLYQLKDLLLKVPHDDECRFHLDGVRHKGTAYLDFVINFVRTETQRRKHPSYLVLEDAAHCYNITNVEGQMPANILNYIRDQQWMMYLTTLTFFAKGTSFYEMYAFKCMSPGFYGGNREFYGKRNKNFMIAITHLRGEFLAASRFQLTRHFWNEHTEIFLHSYDVFLKNFQITVHGANVLVDPKEHTPRYLETIVFSVYHACDIYLKNYLRSEDSKQVEVDEDNIDTKKYLDFLEERSNIFRRLDLMLRSCGMTFEQYIYDINPPVD